MGRMLTTTDLHLEYFDIVVLVGVVAAFVVSVVDEVIVFHNILVKSITIE